MTLIFPEQVLVMGTFEKTLFLNKIKTNNYTKLNFLMSANKWMFFNTIRYPQISKLFEND
jgi:hypothetical protein